MSPDANRPYLTRHQTLLGPRWTVDGLLLPEKFHRDLLVQRPQVAILDALENADTN